MLTALRTGGAIALVAAIGLLDTAVSPLLPFSILYFLPVMAAAWYANRTQGLIVAFAAIATRVATDVRGNGVDPLTVTQGILWGAALVLAPGITTWAHGRREQVAALGGRINELLQMERTFARTDPLTSLCNRRAFVDALQKAEARGRRTGERLPGARADIHG